MEVSMPDNTLFRKVLFGGYHKGDVLSYIENLEAEKESLKFSLQEAETKEPELPPELKAEYESTIAQLQEQVASLKKSSENGSDQLRALREETIQITRRQKREAEDLIRTLQSQVMETLKQFPAQDSTLQHQVREQEGRLMAQATQIKQQSAQLEAQSAQIKQQRTQLEAQSAQIETLQSDLAKKEKDLTSLRKQLVQSGNILQQVQQSLERVQLSEVLPPSTTPFPTPEAPKAPKADKPQTDDSLPELENRLDRLFSDTLNNLNNCEKTAQNTIFHLVKSIS